MSRWNPVRSYISYCWLFSRENTSILETTIQREWGTYPSISLVTGFLGSFFDNKIYFMRNKITDAMIDRLEKEVDMLERHLQVLRMVIENEPIGIVKMSNETGYAHHKIRYSLRVLEEENLIEP